MNSMFSMEIKRCNFIPEGEMAIIKDTNTLIHNIVDSELKEKDKEIDRLNNIIDELEKWLSHKKDIYKTKTGIENNIAHSFSKVALDKLKELKEDNK